VGGHHDADLCCSSVGAAEFQHQQHRASPASKQLQTVQRRATNLPVELFGSNLQESVRPLHEVLQKITGGGVERPINITTNQDRPALMKLIILVTVTFAG
jgi:hypothetical protein